jgi:hypothetical protein
MRRTLLTNPRQLRRSWYMFYFQVPRLPEWYLSRDDARGVVTAIEHTANPGAFTAAELAHYRRAFSRPVKHPSRLNGSPANTASSLDRLPEFELSYLFDNDSNPTEITVFTADPDDKIATHWITVNATATVPLDEIA